IHADLPRDPETLQHRSGRTGRAGRKGTSLFIVPISRRRVAERLIQAARVQATWIPAPTAEAVRARDNERIVEQAKLLAAEEIDEADTALAATLDAPREALAAALIKLLRGPLPAPEELADTGSRERLQPTIREAPRVETEGAVWFHMDVGREGGADPKWLLPFICRRGHVTREEIGRIRILQGETQFEVAAAAAHRFAQASARGEGPDAHIQVEPMQPLPKAAPRADAGPGFVPRGKPPVRKPVRYPAERK
ncbi:MAG: DEAD/DEAH box helicase, partial [Rhodospirillales bacterium]|nr:DEAD/DEAH box helicase [Rhodospirillales bacterium]